MKVKKPHSRSSQTFISIKKEKPQLSDKERYQNSPEAPEGQRSYRLFWKMFPRPIPPRPRPLAATAERNRQISNEDKWND